MANIKSCNERKRMEALADAI